MKDNKNNTDALNGGSMIDKKVEMFMSEGTLDDIDISSIKKKAFIKIRSYERTKKHRRIVMYVTSVAAAFFLLIGIRYVFEEGASYQVRNSDNIEVLAQVLDNEFEVPVGEKMTLILADGTKIVANSRTTVRYPKRFQGKFREVYVKGEAYFDVAPDAEHPFLVYCDQFNVRVLGTRFNVKNYNDLSSQVVLVQGSVELKTSNNDRVRMKPNELVNVQQGSFTEKKTVNANEYTCWMQGFVNLNGEKAYQLIQHLNHYYGVTIICDEEIRNEQLYGKLLLNSRLDDVLSAIGTLTHSSIKQSGDTVYLVRK